MKKILLILLLFPVFATAQNGLISQRQIAAQDTTNIVDAEWQAYVNTWINGVLTDDQTIDVFSLSGNDLQLSLERDGEATKTVDLSGYLDNTDNQNISGSGLSGTDLTIGIESGASETVDLSSLASSYQIFSFTSQNQTEDEIFTALSGYAIIGEHRILQGAVNDGTTVYQTQSVYGVSSNFFSITAVDPTDGTRVTFDIIDGNTAVNFTKMNVMIAY